MTSKNIKKLTLMSLFIAMGIVLSFFERMIPVPFIAPGAKLGLANIITVLTLVIFSRKEAWLILIARVLLVATMFGSVSALIYSLTGGVFSYLGMVIVMYCLKDKVSLVGVSVIGATCHNLGQLTAAALMIQTFRMYSYLPVLMFTSLITGIFVGLVSNILSDRMDFKVLGKGLL